MRGSPMTKTIWSGLLLLFCATVAAQNEVSVRVNVGSQKVAVGEPFLFQILIDGTSDVEAPDLAAETDDFDVEFAGGTQENRTSMTILNGQVSEVVRRAYHLNYRLRARSAGTLVIPSVEVIAGGKAYVTQRVPIGVSEPESSDDFFLTAELSQSTCYVGEAVTLTTVFYIGNPVREVSFFMPALSVDALSVEPLAPARQDYRLVVNGQPVTAEEGRVTRNNSTFVTLTFRHALVPREAGTLSLPQSTVSGQTATGRRTRTSAFFGGTYAPFVAASGTLTLDVKPLPEAGRPADFYGLVGDYAITATASPTSVSVGDPITLNITLSGPHFLQGVDLPPLSQQRALAENFRIPGEMSPGVVDGSSKRFTQTIRAESAGVTEIPPIAISYFDTRSGTYKTAATKAIPLAVREATRVTAADAESFQAPIDTVEHIAVNEGIAHNYTDPSALRPQRFAPHSWLRTAGSWLFLLLPPAFVAALAGARFLRARGGLFPAGRRGRDALPVLEAALDRLDAGQDVYGPVLDGLRDFLGARLDRQANALTYADAEPLLRGRGAAEDSLAELKAIFEACEAHRYAGGAGAPAENEDFVARVRACGRSLNRELGR